MVPPVNVDWTVDCTVAHSQAPRAGLNPTLVQVAHPRWDLASEVTGMSAILTKVTKTKTALKQETYNLSDLTRKHDLQCGFVELGGSVSVSS